MDGKPRNFTVAGRGRGTQGRLAPWLFLAPYLLIFLAFFLLPAVWSALLSVTDWKIVGTPHFVGLRNYARLLSDPLFLTSVKNTVVYTAIIVPLMAVVGLALALLLNQPLRGRVLTRTAVFASYVVMVSVVGIIWRWALDPTGAGIVNYYLGKLGVAPQPWLAAPETAMLSIIIATMWWTAGYNMVMYLAGLQDIPLSLREAARIDGASAWMRFRRITLPLLKPSIFLCFVIGIINSFTSFDLVYVMTQGGPAHATDLLITYTYTVAFKLSKLDYAAALTVVNFLFFLFLALLANRLSGGEAGAVDVGK